MSKGLLTLVRNGIQEDFLVLEDNPLVHVLVAPDKSIVGVYVSRKTCFDEIFSHVTDEELVDDQMRPKERRAIDAAMMGQDFNVDDIDSDGFLGYTIEYMQLQ